MNLAKEQNLKVRMSLDLSDFQDGAGLFCAVLEHFLNLENERPKVLIVKWF